jgi:hypothetical protein
MEISYQFTTLSMNSLVPARNYSHFLRVREFPNTGKLFWMSVQVMAFFINHWMNGYCPSYNGLENRKVCCGKLVAQHSVHLTAFGGRQAVANSLQSGLFADGPSATIGGR